MQLYSYHYIFLLIKWLSWDFGKLCHLNTRQNIWLKIFTVSIGILQMFSILLIFNLKALKKIKEVLLYILDLYSFRSDPQVPTAHLRLLCVMVYVAISAVNAALVASQWQLKTLNFGIVLVWVCFLFLLNSWHSFAYFIMWFHKRPVEIQVLACQVSIVSPQKSMWWSE